MSDDVRESNRAHWDAPAAVHIGFDSISPARRGGARDRRRLLAGVV